MPSFREVKYYLAGLWLLIRMDPRGFSYLDISDRGAPALLLVDPLVHSADRPFLALVATRLSGGHAA